jgi:biotin-[acetyl-CoA-carboxylase] ligase BirA-like protein
MATEVVGRDIRSYDSVSSTNDIARELAADGAANGTVVLAEEQTAARGRYGRHWQSLPGGIQMTVILRPESGSAMLSATAMAAVAVCEAIRCCTNLPAQVKWPNDIVVSDRKVAGVLAESASCVLLGVGVNVNAPSSAFEEELKETASSLSEEAGGEMNKEALLGAILQEMDCLYPAWSAGQIDTLEEEWRSMSDTLGRHIAVVEEGEIYEGRVIDVSLSNGLILELLEGGQRAFPAERTSILRER